MKKTILTVSLIAGLACGNAIAAPSVQTLEEALATCHADSSCPSPTGVLFLTEEEAGYFLNMTGLAWDIKAVRIDGTAFYAIGANG